MSGRRRIGLGGRPFSDFVLGGRPGLRPRDIRGRVVFPRVDDEFVPRRAPFTSFADLVNSLNEEDNLPAELVEFPDVARKLHPSDEFAMDYVRRMRILYPRNLPSGLVYRLERTYGSAQDESELLFRAAKDRYKRWKAASFLRSFTG